MIYQVNHIFNNTQRIKLTDLLGTTQVENFTIKKINGEGSFYVGNENLSTVNYGLVSSQFEGIYFPKINLVINDNLYICGDVGVSISIFAWE